MKLACVVHIDTAIAKGVDVMPDDIPEAVTMSPLPQFAQTAQGVIGGFVAIPVCWECRKVQLKGAANGRLITA